MKKTVRMLQSRIKHCEKNKETVNIKLPPMEAGRREL